MSLTAGSRHIHFIGIGGIGMSGLAELSIKLGHRVTGSDIGEGESVQVLKRMGAYIQIGHDDQMLRKSRPDVVVFSTAISQLENPELKFAREQRIPIIRRAEMLAEIMRLKRGIAIAGSHGKTTTTGIVAQLLRATGLDPTVIIGGRFDAIGSNVAWGEGPWLVAEADESDGSFLRLTPEIAVVTNVDREHLDHYKDFETACRAFEDFLDRLPFYGLSILCSDSEPLKKMDIGLKKPRIWYGSKKENDPDFWVKESSGTEFEIVKRGSAQAWMKIKLSVPGHHNRMNATAAALVADYLGMPATLIAKTLQEFKGVRRRFDLRGEWLGHPIVEDYAHHPTEIQATLEAAQDVYGALRPIVVFQPHRYTRTRDLWKEFGTCFEAALKIYTLPIYAASEENEAWTHPFDRENFAGHVAAHRRGNSARDSVGYCSSLASVLKQLTRDQPLFPKGSPILILGAGDIFKLIPLLLNSES